LPFTDMLCCRADETLTPTIIRVQEALDGAVNEGPATRVILVTANLCQDLQLQEDGSQIVGRQPGFAQVMSHRSIISFMEPILGRNLHYYPLPWVETIFKTMKMLRCMQSRLLKSPTLLTDAHRGWLYAMEYYMDITRNSSSDWVVNQSNVACLIVKRMGLEQILEKFVC
jgi:hypothetical protein